MEPASLDLRQRWRALSRRLGLTTFWRWWAGELVPLIPHRLRHAMARMRMRPVLAFEPDTVVLFVPELANSHLAYQEAARIPRGLELHVPAEWNVGNALRTLEPGVRAGDDRLAVDDQDVALPVVDVAVVPFLLLRPETTSRTRDRHGDEHAPRPAMEHQERLRG